MCDMLVLDDDPLVRVTLVEALRDEGFAVHEAAEEAEVLNVLRGGNRPGVLVTDLDLGTHRSGFVVATMARLIVPGMPVIYITGRPEVANGRSLAAHERLLAKPFRPSDLIAQAKLLMMSGAAAGTA